MPFFEYPYVIITGLLIIVFVMGLIGLYFTMKSAKTAKSAAPKGFCPIGKLEHYYDKDETTPTSRCLVYVSVSLDSMKRLYSETRAMRLYERIKRILHNHFHLRTNGEIAPYGEADFVAFTHWAEEDVTARIDACAQEIREALTKNGAVSVVQLHFGYHRTAAVDVPFKTALERAKQAGNIAEDRQVLCYRWESAAGKEFERKIHVENNIRNEIDNNRFFLEYQPIIDAKTGGVMGAEVLARLNSSTDGILPPDVFLAAVNHGHLDQKFDYYIFEKNCKWIAANKAHRMQHVYTTNFSRHTLCDPRFADNLLEVIQAYELDHSCIAVEILEDTSLTAEEKDTMVRNLNTLKQQGVRILLDDFGNGYTSFNDLTDFAIDIVKIDKSITQKADQPTGLLILKNIVATAHDLGFRTLCEGVETEAQRQAAVEAGCDMMQGFYFYRPMPVPQLETLLDA